MAHTIGKIIAQLRKSNNWTQLELAEKLNVSDKAVSKWETEDSFPSIEFFPALASLFDVSIDYLMTGKVVDNVNLDDMDSTKRMLYLIEHDDAENYVKYGYNQTTYFDDFPSNNHHYNRNTNVSAISHIIQNKSCMIFRACVEAGAKLNPSPMRHYDQTYVGALYEHIDELIKLACLAGSVEFLEKIDFRSFGIGDKNVQLGNRNGPNITSDFYKHTYHIHTNYLINSETLDFIYNTPEIPENIIEYISTYGLSKNPEPSNNNRFYFLEDHILYQLYATKRYHLLNTYLEALEAKMPHNADVEYRSGYYDWTNTAYKMHGNYFIKETDGYDVGSVVCKVVPISSKIFELAASRLDREWLTKFSNYNKRLSESISKDIPVKPLVMTEKEIERALLLHSDIPTKEKLIIECTKDGILYLNQLDRKLRELALSELDEVQKNDRAIVIQKQLAFYKKYMPTILEETCISYYEFVCTLLLKGEYKQVFEFAVDNSLTEIANALIEDKSYDEIETLVKSLFLFAEEELNPYKVICEKIKQAHEQYQNKNSNWDYFQQLETEKERILDQTLSLKKYNDMVRNQTSNLPLEKLITANGNLEFFDKEKTLFFDDIIVSLETEYEFITHEREMADAHSKIMNEITEEYLLELLHDGQTETLVIKLCVKLESILKNQFRYDGELVDMINCLHKITVSEYDDYYEDYREKEKYSTELFNDLYKLRTTRNAMVHAGTNNAEIDVNTLERCMGWIEQLSTEKTGAYNLE